MRRITYEKFQNSDALSAEDWGFLEHLLKYTISALDGDGENQVTFIQFRYAPNTIEVELAFMD